MEIVPSIFILPGVNMKLAYFYEERELRVHAFNSSQFGVFSFLLEHIKIMLTSFHIIIDFTERKKNKAVSMCVISSSTIPTTSY